MALAVQRIRLRRRPCGGGDGGAGRDCVGSSSLQPLHPACSMLHAAFPPLRAHSPSAAMSQSKERQTNLPGASIACFAVKRNRLIHSDRRNFLPRHGVWLQRSILIVLICVLICRQLARSAWSRRVSITCRRNRGQHDGRYHAVGGYATGVLSRSMFRNAFATRAFLSFSWSVRFSPTYSLPFACHARRVIV